MKELVDKVAVITGASRGIGRAIAIGYGAEGATLVLAARTEDDLAKTADACRAAGAADVLTQRCDVAQPDDVRRLIEIAASRFGRIDILVNNAGVGVAGVTDRQYPDMLSTDIEVWHAVLQTNLTSQFVAMKYAAPHIPSGGVIINLGSESARLPYSGTGVYAASKAGSDVLTRTAAVELSKRGIRVNSLSPGLMTDTHLFGPNKMPEAYKRRPYMQPDEIVPAAVWLASEAAADVTGIFLSAHRFNTEGEAGIRARIAAGDRGWA